MAQCKYCGSGTELFVDGVPVCIECDKAMQKHERKPTALELDRDTKGEGR